MSALRGGARIATGTRAPSNGQAWSYPGPMRAMHWATVALLTGAYLAVWAIGDASSAAETAGLAMLHRSFGLTTLVLTGLRLGWRQRSPIPPLPADVPRVQRLAARASILVLYALLVLQPVLGLAGSMLHGDEIVVFGKLVAPVLLPVNRPLAHQVFQLHGWTALLLLALIGAHVAAALHHHFVRGDGVLSGMLPRVQHPPRPARPGSAKLPR